MKDLISGADLLELFKALRKLDDIVKAWDQPAVPVVETGCATCLKPDTHPALPRRGLYR